MIMTLDLLKSHINFPPLLPVLMEGLPVLCIGRFQLDDKAVSHFCPVLVWGSLTGF